MTAPATKRAPRNSRIVILNIGLIVHAHCLDCGWLDFVEGNATMVHHVMTASRQHAIRHRHQVDVFRSERSRYHGETAS